MKKPPSYKEVKATQSREALLKRLESQPKVLIPPETIEKLVAENQHNVGKSLWSMTVTPPKPKDDRPTFDRIWLSLALDLAERSTCSRAKVGCVVVTEDNQRVLALGYNGNWRSGPNECDHPEREGACLCIHAENNALVKLSYDDPAPRKLYTTDSPCEMCAKLVVNARIGSVTYFRAYRKTEGLKILEKARVETKKMGAWDLHLEQDGQK